MSGPINPSLATVADPPIMEVMGWVRQTTFPPDRPLLNLSQAAPVEPPPRPLIQAMADAALNDPGAHLYGPVLGDTALRDEVATRWSTHYGAPIDGGEVAITAGCNQAFCTAVMTLCEPGDQVMLPVPWYFNHKMWLDMTGVEAVPIPCGAGVLPDLEAARAAMGPKVKAIALVTPNNPSGAEYPPGLLGDFYALARTHGACLIVDETYRDFHSAEGAPHRLFGQPDWRDGFIHLYSFSKTFRLTGHRVGAMIAGEARIAQAEKFLGYSHDLPRTPRSDWRALGFAQSGRLGRGRAPRDPRTPGGGGADICRDLAGLAVAGGRGLFRLCRGAHRSAVPRARPAAGGGTIAAGAAWHDVLPRRGVLPRNWRLGRRAQPADCVRKRGSCGA